MRLFPPAFVARRCIEPAMRPPRASAGEKILPFYLSRYLCVTTLGANNDFESDGIVSVGGAVEAAPNYLTSDN